MSEPGFPVPSLEVKKNILERVHLRKDIVPIDMEIADVAIKNDELDSLRERMEDDDEIHWVDLDGGDLELLKENGFKNGGEDSYLISPIGERDWFSDHYFNCTAVVAIGRDANTGKEISFLSHQDPAYFVDGDGDEVERFSREMSDSLKELKARSQTDTVEVLLLGGNFGSDADQQKNYRQSIERLREIIHDSLGFDPRVLTGPNNNVGSETVITVETQKRKVWIERSKQSPEFDQSYMANTLDEEVEKWLKVGK